MHPDFRAPVFSLLWHTFSSKVEVKLYLEVKIYFLRVTSQRGSTISFSKHLQKTSLGSTFIPNPLFEWLLKSVQFLLSFGFFTRKQNNDGTYIICSAQLSRSVVSGSLRPQGLQHTRPPCPSPTPRVYSNSCPLSRWCHPTISFSVLPFSSCLQSFQASGSFQWASSLHQVAKVLDFQL